MPSAQENASPYYFEARGLSDSLATAEDFPGAMASLQNLVFDPSSSHVVQCRPAAIPLLNSSAVAKIVGLDFISDYKLVGDILYGMAASSQYPGFDKPFAFNLATNQVVPVTGFAAGNLPATQPFVGDWTPPTMDVIGTKVVVTHPGFAQGAFATATDKITFSAQPSNGDALTFGAQVTNQSGVTPGSLVTFVTGAPAAYQVQIGATLAATLANLATFLTQSGDANLGAITATATSTVLNVSYITPGIDGNSYPISSQTPVANVANPTLTGGSGYYFGWLDVTNPLAPVWGAGNCAINPLPSPPVAVAQFNSRAYFICNPLNSTPGLIPSDPLAATVRTNGSYVLTFGDNQALTALAGLPLSNQLGGVIQSLIVFKDTTNMYQVTGDPLPNTAAGAWSKNTLNVATGTLAARSIASTPLGLAFMSPQGLRFIDFTARVGPPAGADGKGISVPFIGCPVPSRMSAACNAKFYRISLTTAAGLQWEFWLELAKMTWTGPHTIASNVIAAYKNTFIIAPIAIPNALYQSDWRISASSTFLEFGAQMQWTWQPSFFPNAKDLLQHEMHETNIEFYSSTGATILLADEGGNIITDALGNNPAKATLPAGSVNVNWSAAMWQSSVMYNRKYAMSPVTVPWPGPIAYGRATLQMSGISDSVTRIGALTSRIEQLGYLPQPGD